MTTVRAWTPADGERWDAYVRTSPHAHFGQRIAWKVLTERRYGVRGEYRMAERDGRVVGILPLLRRGGRRPRLFSAPGGLLADDAATAAALLAPVREQVAREGLWWAELRDQRVAWDGLETNREHVTMVLDLATSPEEQWKAFDAKLRNQVRKGEKSGFERSWGHGGVADFHRVMVENLRDLGTPVRGLGYYADALALLGDDADVLVLRLDGEAAGAMFTVRHADTVTDPWASSLRRHFARCPNQVLYWEALQRAIARGARRFDFGRSQWESPTFRFKQQWGAQPVPLHYQYILGAGATMPTLAAQKGGFSLAVELWRRLPVPVARLLGEPAKRMFPEVL
jgi:FemAB-related protein (PEP-CTERM system-associated)